MSASVSKRFARMVLQQNKDKFLVKQCIASFCQSTPQVVTRTSEDCELPKRYLGQPSSYTHPHLIKEGEVIPNISKEEFRLRRSRLIKELSKSGKHIVVVPSAETVEMSPDVPYFFRQDTDFLYLTGFQEPSSALVLESDRDSVEGFVSTLFVQERNPQKELWGGSRTGTKDVLNLTGVDRGQGIRDIFQHYSTFSEQNQDFTLWYKPAMLGQLFHKQFYEAMRHDYVSVKHAIHNLRVVKSEAEIELMQKSCDIASEAFIEVLKFSQSGVNESHLFAKMDYECRMNGAEFLAYPPVVAGGNRACTIHYISNNQIVREGELVLMDAGCEYHGYASDITRTWPVSGKFSKVQRQVYESVLRVQLACINLCTVGNTLDSIFKSMVEYVAEEMKVLGLVSSHTDNSDAMLQFAARQLCPHHVGHYLGMDVHDTDSVSRMRPLENGMIITVEPGIYIREDDARFPEKFRGIGIRIEDDILITDQGPVVLTKKCPKSVEEIEDLASQD